MRLFSCLALLTVVSGCVSTRPAERQLSVDQISPHRVFRRATIWLFEPDGFTVRTSAPVRDLHLLPDSAHWRYADETQGGASITNVHAFEVEERQAVQGFGEGAIVGLIVGGAIAAGFLAAGELDCRRAPQDADSCGFQAYGAFLGLPVATAFTLVGLLNGASTKRVVRVVLNPVPAQ